MKTFRVTFQGGGSVLVFAEAYKKHAFFADFLVNGQTVAHVQQFVEIEEVEE